LTPMAREGGSQEWMYVRGGAVRRKHPVKGRLHLAYAPESSRAKMGPNRRRKSPRVAAACKRQYRAKVTSCDRVVASQVLVAKRRLTKGVCAPNRSELLKKFRGFAKKKNGRKAPIEVGSVVRFVPPGPRKARTMRLGTVIAFPTRDKTGMVAVDTRIATHRPLLSGIEVIPMQDCIVVDFEAC
jgi:hypothetical protein